MNCSFKLVQFLQKRRIASSVSYCLKYIFCIIHLDIFFMLTVLNLRKSVFIMYSERRRKSNIILICKTLLTLRGAGKPLCTLSIRSTQIYALIVLCMGLKKKA